MSIAFGLFLVAHGVVHAIYVGQAVHAFEVKPGLAWPDGSWALSWAGDSTVRGLVAVTFALVTVAFVVAGVGLAFGQQWWAILASVAAVASSVILLLAWNGQAVSLDAQGAFALFINAAIVILALVVRWPATG